MSRNLLLPIFLIYSLTFQNNAMERDAFVVFNTTDTEEVVRFYGPDDIQTGVEKIKPNSGIEIPRDLARPISVTTEITRRIKLTPNPDDSTMMVSYYALLKARTLYIERYGIEAADSYYGPISTINRDTTSHEISTKVPRSFTGTIVLETFNNSATDRARPSSAARVETPFEFWRGWTPSPSPSLSVAAGSPTPFAPIK